jgi:hypothetical protein
VIIQLSPTIPLDTPKGPSLALFLIEAGDEHDLQWVCAVQSGEHVNEIWTWRNRDVRTRANVTMGRPASAESDMIPVKGLYYPDFKEFRPGSIFRCAAKASDDAK